MNVPVISDKLPQSKSYVNVEVLQIQFIVTVLDIPVVTQRRLPTVQTVLKTGELPQVQFLDLVDMPVIVQRQVRSLRQRMSSTPLSWRRCRFPWSVFLRFSSCGTSIRWSSCVVQVLQFVRRCGRQSRSHSCSPFFGPGR